VTGEISDLDRNECFRLLRAAGLAHTSETTIEAMEGGVWNNRLRHITEDKWQFAMKRFQPQIADSPMYNPPPISAEVRARSSINAQLAAQQLLATDSARVPGIIAATECAFLMDYVHDASSLFEALSCGTVELDSLSESLANVLAKLHATNAPLMSRFCRNPMVPYKSSLQYGSIQQSTCRAESLRELEDEIVNPSAAAQRFCHGDFNSRNILLDSNGGVHIVDFEHAGLSHPTYDLAYLLSEIVIWQLAWPALQSVFVSRFLAEYRRSTPVPLDAFSTLWKHVAIHILYRFDGPSSSRWTGYVSETVESRCRSVARTILQDPSSSGLHLQIPNTVQEEIS